MHRGYRLILLPALLVALPAAALAQYTPIGSLHCNDANGVPLQNLMGHVVRGIVTANMPTGTNNRLFIQDATGGLNIFGTPQDCALAMGDDIEVQGTVIDFNGLTEVAGGPTVPPTPPLAINVVSSGNPQPAPLMLTIAQINATYQADNCEPNESRLVRVENVYVRTSTGGMPSGNFLANANYRIINNGPDSTTNFTTLRVVQSTNACNVTNGLVGQPIPIACPVNATGVLAQFDSTVPKNSGYQLQPRLSTDVELNCATPTRATTWGHVKSIYR
jgi:hypothetical protein